MVLAYVQPATAAQPEMSGSIKEMMSPAEFNAAGLNKLSADELQKLDAWLQGYRQVTEQAAEKKATERASRTKMDLIVSRVDGAFYGLTGRTIIRLEDGTVWKQANADDRYRSRVTDHPAAAVIHGVFGYKMRMEGTQEFYCRSGAQSVTESGNGCAAASAGSNRPRPNSAWINRAARSASFSSIITAILISDVDTS